MRSWQPGKRRPLYSALDRKYERETIDLAKNLNRLHKDVAH